MKKIKFKKDYKNFKANDEIEIMYDRNVTRRVREVLSTEFIYKENGKKQVLKVSNEDIDSIELIEK